MSAERRGGLGEQLDEMRALGCEANERARRILAMIERQQERDAAQVKPGTEATAADAEPV